MNIHLPITINSRPIPNPRRPPTKTVRRQNDQPISSNLPNKTHNLPNPQTHPLRIRLSRPLGQPPRQTRNALAPKTRRDKILPSTLLFKQSSALHVTIAMHASSYQPCTPRSPELPKTDTPSFTPPHGPNAKLKKTSPPYQPRATLRTTVSWS